MGLEDKFILISEINKELYSKLTTQDADMVREILMDRLDDFEVTRICLSAGRNGDDLLQAFLDAKAVEGRSEKTIIRYRYVINCLLNSCKISVREVSVYHIRKFLMDEKNRGLSDSTLEGYREVYSSFFGWLYREQLIPRNPMNNIFKIKCKKEVRLPYSDAEIEKLKEACRTERDKAIIVFLLSTGCRISEMCQLDRGQVDFRDLECTVLGKGNKERTVFLDDVSAMLLARYLASRSDTSPALFIGKGNQRLEPGGVRKRLHEIGTRAGVDNVHPHRFRRTLATNLINHGMAIQEVATILGHERLDTTMTYIHISKKTVKTAYEKYA